MTMNRLRKILTTGAIASMIGVGALAATTTEAGAYTACNRYGECWHTGERYGYPGAIGVRFYGDDWRWRDHGYRWRGDNWRGDRNWHHRGRGYWRNGIWITF
jgi:hypothetical protein